MAKEERRRRAAEEGVAGAAGGPAFRSRSRTAGSGFSASRLTSERAEAIASSRIERHRRLLGFGRF